MFGDFIKIKTHAILLLASGGAFLYGVRTPEINSYVDHLFSKDDSDLATSDAGGSSDQLREDGGSAEEVVASQVGHSMPAQQQPSNKENPQSDSPPDLSSALDSVRRPADYTPPSLPMNSMEMAPEGGPVAPAYQSPTFRDLPGSGELDEDLGAGEEDEIVGDDEALDESVDSADEELGEEPVDDEGL